MKANPLLELEKLRQSIWMDFIRRETIASGELARMIKDDGISGVTSNPSIFEKAIAESHDYDENVRSLVQADKSVEEIYGELTVDDIRNAADVFRPLYDKTKGGDGYVSLEVSPNLARDAGGTIAEAKHLWSAVGRPNIYIKVPGTKEGLTAIRELIGEGINVNVTLLFGLPRYREVTEAYFAGLEARLEKGLAIDQISSVASFFLSRIDVLVDKVLEAKMAAKGEEAEKAKQVHGQTAIASARIAYEMYKEIFGSERFKKLSAKGARNQRLLWASTSTKNPTYSDVKYVEALIGTETVNTLPLETIDAYRDHGKPAARLEDEINGAHDVMGKLPSLGIDIDKVTQQLEDEGVKKFSDAYEALLKALRGKREAAKRETVSK